eukprot:CAMPEP_0196579110 /NCGR_PEP_ID=MMETSP1081-20130531/17653_1 /TAXON_ID=36882 /ORGANISM="Pyramimonas amylifera, Strain CCMP720" /LENGTH=155 /DNA_ID=CAMNT_0041898573 /DNA_START=301 /DNA_END=768 /DNA_ORIENTATION=-
MSVESADPTWMKVAERLQGRVLVGHVNVEKNPRLVKRFLNPTRVWSWESNTWDDQTSNPVTLFLFRDRKMYPYDGRWEEDELVEFALKSFAKQNGVTVPFEPNYLTNILFNEGFVLGEMRLYHVAASLAIILCTILAVVPTYNLLMFKKKNNYMD